VGGVLCMEPALARTDHDKIVGHTGMLRLRRSSRTITTVSPAHLRVLRCARVNKGGEIPWSCHGKSGSTMVWCTAVTIFFMATVAEVAQGGRVENGQDTSQYAGAQISARHWKHTQEHFARQDERHGTCAVHVQLILSTKQLLAVESFTHPMFFCAPAKITANLLTSTLLERMFDDMSQTSGTSPVSGTNGTSTCTQEEKYNEGE
jgi:hypothetical protein